MAKQMMQGTATNMAANQAIPAGYKQTEMGVIPEDWLVRKIGDISEVIRGASPRPKGDKRFYGGSVPRLMVEDVSRDGKHVTPSVDSLTEAGAKLSRPCVAGTLTLVCSGVVGVPSILAVDACIHDGFLGLTKVNKSVLIDYLYHFFTTQQEKLNNSATHGGVFTNLTTDGVRDFIIAIPADKKEQTAIAIALSDTDTLITGLEQLIAKKQAIKTATMQQLLTGRTRLPQFALHSDGTPKGYKSSELGQIPEDWKVVSAGEIGKFRGGNGFPTVEQGMATGEYPFYKVSDMNNEGNEIFMSASNNWVSSEVKTRLGCNVFPDGCIVFAKVGAAIFLERKRILSMQSCIDNNMAAFDLSNTNNDVLFIYFLLQSIRFGDLVSTTALPSLSGSTLSSIQFAIPSSNEQATIATILSDMDNELTALEKKLAKARSIKQGMMQQLLTGRIRLPLGSITNQEESHAN